MSKKRDLNMEVLRILSMFMVVILHALGHGGTLWVYPLNTSGYIFFWFLETLCYIAVNCFVLISGYFMIRSEMKFGKILKTFIQVETYSILGTLIGCWVFKQPITMDVIRMTLFPITSNSYWFVTSYIILMVFSPFLNKFLHSLEKKDFEKLLITMLVVFSVIPSVLFWSKDLLGTGYNFVWFIVLYCIAAYIRLHKFEIPKKYGWLYFGLAALGVLSRLIIGNVTLKLFGYERMTDLLYCYNSVLVVGMSVLIFSIFTQIKIKDTKWTKAILFFSANSFGVYLWHEHFLIRAPLWNVLNIPQMTSKGVLITFCYVILIAVAIYIIGCCVEYVRNKISTKLTEKRKEAR